jgi:ElaB/YqjD/DUF883 family membrane-anchored ribosome-binding protein
MEGQAMEATRDRLVSDFKTLLGDVEELLGATSGQAGERAREVRQRLEQRIDEGRKSLADAEALLMGKGKEAVDNAHKYVRENPLNAVAIAAGVGLIVGLLARRR